MTSALSRVGRQCGLFLAVLLATWILSGCGDKDADQRKAFIDFLQNTAMRSGEQLPALSSDQKKKFGPYVNDYATLYDFARQINHARSDAVKPVVAELNAIRTPQDYITRNAALRQASSALGVIIQQLQAAKTQADDSKRRLKQAADLQAVYDKAYAQVVTQPAGQLMPLLPALQALSQDAIKAGDFLQQQGGNVTINGMAVQFPDQQQASTYNAIMSRLAQSTQVLSRAQILLQ